MATCRSKTSYVELANRSQVVDLQDLSEIPCRVSNIAQDSGDTIPMTGSNRWNPNDVCASASRAIPRVRFRAGAFGVTWFPRNDLRNEILRWSRHLVHNTPALTAKKR